MATVTGSVLLRSLKNFITFSIGLVKIASQIYLSEQNFSFFFANWTVIIKCHNLYTLYDIHIIIERKTLSIRKVWKYGKKFSYGTAKILYKMCTV